MMPTQVSVCLPANLPATQWSKVESSKNKPSNTTNTTNTTNTNTTNSTNHVINSQAGLLPHARHVG